LAILPASIQGQTRGFDGGSGRAFAGRARAQRIGEDQPVAHQAHEVDLRLRSALSCDEDIAPERLQARFFGV
jgi:hypothetical protein